MLQVYHASLGILTLLFPLLPLLSSRPPCLFSSAPLCSHSSSTYRFRNAVMRPSNHARNAFNLPLFQISHLKPHLLRLCMLLKPLLTAKLSHSPNLPSHKPPLQPHLRSHSACNRQIRNSKQETNQNKDGLRKELGCADGDGRDIYECSDDDRDGQGHNEEQVEFVRYGYTGRFVPDWSQTCCCECGDCENQANNLKKY
jgi:hypothetical protein